MNRKTKILQAFIVAAVALMAVRASGFLNAPRAPREFKLQAESPRFWDLVDPNAKLGIGRHGLWIYRGPRLGRGRLPLCKR